jgi:transposase
MTGAAASVFLDPALFAYVVGVDIGSETCCFTVLTPQKQVVIKPSDLANAASGFNRLQEQLAGLGEHPARIVVGMEATSRNAGESLSVSPATRLSPVFVAPPTNP